MSQNNHIVPSISLTVMALMAVQLAFVRVVLGWEARGTLTGFVVATAAVHLLLLVVLVALRGDFVLVPSGIVLRRVNIANVLTLFRISSTPTILFLLMEVREDDVVGALLVWCTAAFLSDFFDGRLSRRLRQVTRIGRYLDSMSDYAMLTAICLAMAGYGLISRPFVVLLLLRFGVQGIGVTTLLFYHGHLEPHSSFWGKVSVFATMTYCGLALLRLVRGAAGVWVTVQPFAEAFTALLVVISVLDKLRLFRQGWRGLGPHVRR